MVDRVGSYFIALYDSKALALYSLVLVQRTGFLDLARKIDADPLLEY